jgi:hypothetical protein
MPIFFAPLVSIPTSLLPLPTLAIAAPIEIPMLA